MSDTNINPQQNNTKSSDFQDQGIFGKINLNQQQENPNQAQGQTQTGQSNTENKKTPSPESNSLSNNLEQEKQEEIQELKNFGVDVLDESPSRSDSNIFSDKKDSPTKSFFDESVVIGAGKKEPEIVDISSYVKKNKATEPSVDTKDLEKDFSDTFNSIESHEEKNNSLEMEELRLKDLHQKLKRKAEEKKHAVKQKLEQLKQEKETLGKELVAIKEIEETAIQIEEKLQTLHQIDTDLDSIEDKARQELNQ